MSLFDGLPDIFTDPDVGFGESVVYTPASSPTSPETINAVWTERAASPELGEFLKADAIILTVGVRSDDVPDLAEGDLFERDATGVVGKAVPPFKPDGEGMITVTLERVSS